MTSVIHRDITNIENNTSNINNSSSKLDDPKQESANDSHSPLSQHNNQDDSSVGSTKSSEKKPPKPVKIPAPISDISKTIPVTGEKPRPDKEVSPMEDEVLHAVFVILFEFDPSEEGMTVKQMCDYLLERHPDMSQLSTKLSNLISAKLNAYVKKVEKGEKLLTYCLSREWADTSPRRMVYIYRGLLDSNYQEYAHAAAKKLQHLQKSKNTGSGTSVKNGDNRSFSSVSSMNSLQNYTDQGASDYEDDVEDGGNGNSAKVSSKNSTHSSTPYTNTANSTLLDSNNSGQFVRSLSVSNSKDFFPFGNSQSSSHNSSSKNINRFSITYDSRFSNLPFNSSISSISINLDNNGDRSSISNQYLKNLNSLSVLDLNTSTSLHQGKSIVNAQNNRIENIHLNEDDEEDDEDDEDEDDEDDEDDEASSMRNSKSGNTAMKRVAPHAMKQNRNKIPKRNSNSVSSSSNSTTNDSYTTDSSHEPASAKYVTAAAAAPRLTRNSFQNEHMNSPQVAAAVAAIQRAVITENPVGIEQPAYISLAAQTIPFEQDETHVSSPSATSSVSGNSSFSANNSKSPTPEPVCAQWLKTVRAGFLNEDIVKPENVSLDELDGLFD